MGGGGEYVRVPPNKGECAKNKIDPAYRDYCSHLLIPLNKCRYANYFLPWKCTEERHAYEKCQFQEFEYRVKKLQEQS
ncbi:hypothetical protein GUITHDRAFT_97918 [Guillardia theta CCMP2712]|uniref:NADH dehydrogenase [ubiquinone] 1 beta subcomplex subunit 7 n=1 Tax=Guillardia theta (strain CCMP2712) TaxID=905079 RepID=L1IH07_GUITC|nr:hypothetical protein GUITHDRAFT_97918 [Guillardia theta CCMP2712]EKX35115.1 hypothetical protein GUITHDRAFT_97918 [Guillardia theta CCMP2712]|eukprot:XP_005822095.1 hypothetical protein GUITHDRAFT_97918 [Guillardia theta CCMP2712]